MTQTISININSQLLANAQSYSKKIGSDISHFIEVLLYQVVPTSDRTSSEEVIKSIDQLSHFVQSLCGVVKKPYVPDNDIDGNDARLEYLEGNL